MHASSFVRAQSLGYKGFKDLQVVFQRRLSTLRQASTHGSRPWKANWEGRGKGM
ncbi:MAG: hypothetical protein M9957_01490 [Rhodobacteraceae bacterium]|nr:hypothetical protein [Paracoccaceae bacterium]